MPGHTRQQHQNVVIIEQFRTKEGRRNYHSEIDTAPIPLDPKASTPGAITWPVHYLYSSDHILVRDEYIDRVHPIVRGLGNTKNPTVTPVIRGLHQLALCRKVTVPDAVNAVSERLGRGVAAPDHIITLTIGNGTGGACPACEPQPVDADTDPRPAVSKIPGSGKGVRVVVVDTGIDPGAIEAHTWLRAGITGEPDKMVFSTGELGLYAGHGTFIAGLIKAVAPEAEVHVRADITAGGVIKESELVQALEEVLINDNPDIINLSAGVWSGGAAGPVGFQVFHESVLRHHKGVVVVAAAGNDHSRRPFWPAASPWAVGVGALTADGKHRADFSNYGGWVDAYAPGQDLINAFPVGTYRYTEPPLPPNPTVSFEGMASWSGTSFATPVVAGMIAARMSTTGENGVDAAQGLLRDARPAPESGGGVRLMP